VKDSIDEDGLFSPERGRTGREDSLRSVGNDLEGAVELFDFDPPPPRQWRVSDFIPENHLTMLIGDGGTGKSYLALYLGLCVASGQPFLGKETRQGRVLYLDYELNANELKRRTTSVAAGMGLDLHGNKALQDQIYYYRPEHPLGAEGHEKELSILREPGAADLVILDSLTIASTGDMKDHSDFNRVAREIRQWPTTLAIDHVSHSTAKQGPRNARAFGSVFKRNTARSSLTLGKREEVLRLAQEKSNFNAGDSKLFYLMEFESDRVRFERIDFKDERTDAYNDDLSTHDLTVKAVEQIHNDTSEPVSTSSVVEWREERSDDDISQATIANHYRDLEDEGRLDRKSTKEALPVDENGGGSG
jgi:RecA-family ATPase